MKTKINIDRENGTNEINKRKGLEASVLTVGGSPMNAGSRLAPGAFIGSFTVTYCLVYFWSRVRVSRFWLIEARLLLG